MKAAGLKIAIAVIKYELNRKYFRIPSIKICDDILKKTPAWHLRLDSGN